MIIKNFLPYSELSFNASPVTIVIPTTEREAVQVCVIGSLNGIEGIVYDLHQRNFAEVNDWSKPQPTGKSGEYIRLLRRHVLRRQ